MDQSHSRLRFSAGAKLCDASLHSPCPIRICQRAGNIEAVFARQQIGDHDDGKPRLALEKRFHDRRIEILFEVDLVDGWLETGEDASRGNKWCSRLTASVVASHSSSAG